jgi:hypothetical protein
MRVGLPARSTSAGGFSVPEAAPVGGNAAVSVGEAGPVMLGGMIALQELGDERLEDRAARRRGHELLAALSGLQRALLADADDLEPLARLAGLAAEIPAAADPRLKEAVAAIVLRARVELAKRGL